MTETILKRGRGRPRKHPVQQLRDTGDVIHVEQSAESDPPPPLDPALGDKTPAFLIWLQKTNPGSLSTGQRRTLEKLGKLKLNIDRHERSSTGPDNERTRPDTAER